MKSTTNKSIARYNYVTQLPGIDEEIIPKLCDTISDFFSKNSDNISINIKSPKIKYSEIIKYPIPFI
jgi:hypothetical protein